MPEGEHPRAGERQRLLHHQVRPEGGQLSLHLSEGRLRGTGGSFAPDAPIALRVYNAPDAVNVTWYFDGQRIAPGADGYYHLTRSGTLKAVVTYSDSTEIITKKIVVK